MQESRVGIGWRQPHYSELLQTLPALDFLEVHSENFFGAGGAALATLESARAHYPISLHGVGLSLGSPRGVDPWHLDQLATLVARIEPIRVSDHACFARGQLKGQPMHAADLLPIAFNQDVLDVLCANVQQVQERLKRPLLIENLSAYLGLAGCDTSETDFLNQLAQRTGCQLLIDVNNIYVNALNAQAANPLQTCAAWLDQILPSAVGQLHIAGYVDCGDIVIDNHGSPACDAVWSLYAHAQARFGGVPALVEWDTDVPALHVLLSEVARARVMGQRPENRHPVARSGPLDLRLYGEDGSGESWAGGSEILAALFDTAASPHRGLRAYRANAQALAARALAAAYPVLEQLIGTENFAQLAHHFWLEKPPEKGDLAQWGGALAAFLQEQPQLANEPYLPDVARLEWLLHQAATAADGVLDADSFGLLATCEPENLILTLAPGFALLASNYPVVSIVNAHLNGQIDQLRSVNLSRGELAVVWRCGFKPQTRTCFKKEFELLAVFGVQHTLQTVSVEFDFASWLSRAVQSGLVLGVKALAFDAANLQQDAKEMRHVALGNDKQGL